MPVNIRVYTLDFLKSDEKRLFRFLSQSDELEIFEDSFIADLLWNSQLRNQLILYGLIPYIFYMVLSLFYYTTVLAKKDGLAWIILILIFLFWLLYLEIRQARQNFVSYI